MFSYFITKYIEFADAISSYWLGSEMNIYVLGEREM